MALSRLKNLSLVSTFTVGSAKIAFGLTDIDNLGI